MRCTAMVLTDLKEPCFEKDSFVRAIFFRLKKEKIFPAQKEDAESSEETKSQVVGKSGQISGQKENLLKKGLLRRIGADRGGYWEVVGG